MGSLVHSVIPFLGGLIIGGLLVWLLSPALRNLRRLEEEKEKAEQALKDYRAEVDQHFLRTADTLSDLTQAYRTLHEQLTQGAEALCSEDSKREVMSKTVSSLVAVVNPEGGDFLTQQPLDYAPESQGTLAEDYGFRKQAPASTSRNSQNRATRDYAEGCDDQGCSPATGGRPN